MKKIDWSKYPYGLVTQIFRKPDGTLGSITEPGLPDSANPYMKQIRASDKRRGVRWGTAGEAKASAKRSRKAA